MGHADPLHWAVSRFCGDLLWGVEDNRSVAGLLEQDLLSCGIKASGSNHTLVGAVYAGIAVAKSVVAQFISAINLKG